MQTPDEDNQMEATFLFSPFRDQHWKWSDSSRNAPTQIKQYIGSHAVIAMVWLWPDLIKQEVPGRGD